MRLTSGLAVSGAAATVGCIAYGAYVGLVTGRLTLDLGVGRRERSLGPLVVDIAASPEVVYAVVTAPYGERPTRAMQEKVQVLSRSDSMVLAAHRTPVGRRLTAVTVETVTFRPPERVEFRLLRGPVPHVSETFELQPHRDGTRLRYTGRLGTDLGRVGAWWGDLVARSWVRTVQDSLAEVKQEGERRSR